MENYRFNQIEICIGKYENRFQSAEQTISDVILLLPEVEKQLIELQQTASKRSAQIGDLKNKLIKAQQQLLEHNHFVCSRCPELANNPKREGNFGCLGCKYFIER